MSLLLPLLHLVLLAPPLWAAVLVGRRNSVLCLCMLVKSLPCRSSVLGGVPRGLCVFWFCLEASCPSAAPPNSLLLSHCPHMSLAAGLPEMPPCHILPGVVLQGYSLCLRGYGHGFFSF